MKVIICGAGQVGWQIARHLSGELNDVTVVDSNPELVKRATDTLDVQGIAGFASYPDVLQNIGIGRKARDPLNVQCIRGALDQFRVTVDNRHVVQLTRQVACDLPAHLASPADYDLHLSGPAWEIR